ncbi:hypothetical protein EYD10_18340, partial [Varanus komodoensis]
VVTKFYQHILALVLAVHEINENPEILLNITLGFHIYDSYSDSRMTYHNTLDLVCKSKIFVPNYKCDNQKNLIGVIGGLDFDMTLHMKDLLSLYKIPQNCETTAIHFLCSVVSKFYQHILALVFAINEINENPKILYNITLGFQIYDNYFDSRMTYRTSLDLLFKLRKVVPNYKCGSQKYLIGVIGGLSADTSSRMAEVFRLYKIPQFSYGSFETTASDESPLPSFYRMVPNEALQYQGIIQLLHHFQWKWIGLLTMDDEGGEHFLQTMEPMLSMNGICSEFTERLETNWHFLDLPEVINRTLGHLPIFMNKKANAILMYGENTTIMWLASIILVATVFPLTDREYSDKISTTRVWIATAQIDFTVHILQKAFDIQMLHGAISFTIHSKELPGFRKFIELISPSGTKADGFITNFWEQAFGCPMPGSDVSANINETCTGKEKLETIPSPFFEMAMTGHSYSIYNAAYALAHALHTSHTSVSRHRTVKDGTRLAPPNVEPWQLHSLLQRLSFNNSAGDEVSFNEDGELVGGFDIMNLVTFPNNSFVRVEVGRLDSQGSPDKIFILHEDRLQWHRDFVQVPPSSSCNDPCPLGYGKTKQEGEKFCCYGCSSCPESMVSGQMVVELLKESTITPVIQELLQTIQ